MLKTRVIPCLLLMNKGLYKTVKFKTPAYIGDPINAVRIYNDKEVDELIFLDITASSEGKEPNYKLIADIASECFMPLTYGGGIHSLDQVKHIFEVGVEKISLNKAAVSNPKLITEIANYFGIQAVITSIDVKKNFWGKYEVHGDRGTKSIGKNPVDFAKEMESAGAGEIMLTSIDREGSWEGYDLDLVKKVSDSVKIPVIANGGAGSLQHLSDAVKTGKASAVAIGSMAVYQKKGFGVLINFPTRESLEQTLI